MGKDENFMDVIDRYKIGAKKTFAAFLLLDQFQNHLIFCPLTINGYYNTCIIFSLPIDKLFSCSAFMHSYVLFPCDPRKIIKKVLVLTRRLRTETCL